MRNDNHNCCGGGGAWFNKCGNPDDSEFNHTWSEGIGACSAEVGSIIMSEVIDSTSHNVMSMLSCDQASDYMGINVIDGGQTCESVVVFMLPVSPEECDDKIDGCQGEHAEIFTRCMLYV